MTNMKWSISAVIMTISVLLAGSACATLLPEPTATLEVRRLSLTEAEHLIHYSVSFTELTTDEIWERLGAQIYQENNNSNYEYQGYLIKNKEVTQLGSSFGGYGLTSMCVTDLDQNGQAELVYTFSWGSGQHRSQLALYSPDIPETHSIVAGIDFYDWDWTVEKLDDQTAWVKIGDTRIGQVVFKSQAGPPTLDIQLVEGLPASIRKHIHDRFPESTFDEEQIEIFDNK